MGLFDDGDAGGLGGLLPEGMAKPAVIAIGALLLKHMLANKNAPASAPAPDAGQGGLGGLLGGLLGGGQQGGAPAGGGLGGGLGGALAGGAAAGGLLGGLGGLLEQFRNAGHGQAVDSWVSQGANQPIQPQQVGQAIGQQTLSEIAAQAGMSEQDLLQALAHALPQIVDRATPNGQLPGGFGRI